MNTELLVAAAVGLAVIYLMIAGYIAIAAALHVGGWHQTPIDASDPRAASRLTLPVSLIVPLTEGAPRASETIAALLDLNYPELEVIVVSDTSNRSVTASLVEEWELEAMEFFYRRTIHTSEIHRFYRSDRDWRLTLIEKAPGGYHDALNCAMNLARYRYVVSIPSGSVFEPEALLGLMSPLLADPGLVGVSGHVEHTEPSEQLAAARLLMGSLIGWRHLRAGLPPAGSLVAWRRDAVHAVGGFRRTAEPDLDLMLRLWASSSEPMRFVRGARVFGRVERSTASRRTRFAGRREIAAVRLLGIWLRHAGRSPSFGVLAHVVGAELLTPLAEACVVVGTVVGAAAGWCSWTAPVLAIAFLAFGNAAVNAAALLVRGSLPGAPSETGLRRLLRLSPLHLHPSIR